MDRPHRTGAERARADAGGRAIVSIALLLAVVAATSGLYFAFTGTELVDSGGRTLDCGSLVQTATTTLALANCGGVNDSNLAPLVASALVLVVAIVLVAGLLWKRSRRIHW